MSIPSVSFYSSNYRNLNQAALDAETSLTFSVDIASHGFHICQQCSCTWCTDQLRGDVPDSGASSSSSAAAAAAAAAAATVQGPSASKSDEYLRHLPPLQKIFSIKCGSGRQHERFNRSKVKGISNKLIIPLKSQLIFENLPLDHIFHLDPQECKCFICSAYAKHGIVPVPKQWAARQFTVMQYDDADSSGQQIFEMKCFNGISVNAHTRGPFPTFNLVGHVFNVCKECKCPTCEVLTDRSTNAVAHAAILGELQRKAGATRACSSLAYPTGAIIHKAPDKQVAFMNRQFNVASNRLAEAYTKQHLFHIDPNCRCEICSSLAFDGVLKIPGNWYGRSFAFVRLVDKSLEGLSYAEVKDIMKQKEIEALQTITNRRMITSYSSDEAELLRNYEYSNFFNRYPLLSNSLTGNNGTLLSQLPPDTSDCSTFSAHSYHSSEETTEAPETAEANQVLGMMQPEGKNQEKAQPKKKKPNKKKGKKKGRK